MDPLPKEKSISYFNQNVTDKERAKMKQNKKKKREKEKPLFLWGSHSLTCYFHPLGFEETCKKKNEKVFFVCFWDLISTHFGEKTEIFFLKVWLYLSVGFLYHTWAAEHVKDVY